MLRILSGMVIGGILGWAIVRFREKEATLGYMDISLLYDPLEEKLAKLEFEDYIEKELAKLKEKLANKKTKVS